MNNGQKKKVRGRPRTVKRERAVELAMEAYWREGIHTLSLNELCRRSEISKPAFYREFGNEDGLMKAVLEHYRQSVILPLLALSDVKQPFAEVLEQVIVGLTSEGETPVGCLFTQMRLAKPRLGEETLERLRTLEEERLNVFEDWYRKSLKSGEVSTTLDPALAARYIDTQFTIVLMQMSAGEPPDSVREVARLAFRLLLP